MDSIVIEFTKITTTLYPVTPALRCFFFNDIKNYHFDFVKNFKSMGICIISG